MRWPQNKNIEITAAGSVQESAVGVELRCETKITGTNYRTVSQDVQLLIDESFAEKIIPANDSVRLLDEIVEEMDLTLLMRA